MRLQTCLSLYIYIHMFLYPYGICHMHPSTLWRFLDYAGELMSNKEFVQMRHLVEVGRKAWGQDGPCGS